MTTTTRAPRALSQRNLDILYDVARFQLLSTRQVHGLHFAAKGSTETASAKLLARLEQHGYLNHTFTYGRTRQTAHGLSKTRPDKVWYLPPDCQTKLRSDLSRLSRLSEFDRFIDHSKAYNKTKTFSDQALPHELGINSCLMALERLADAARIVDLTWIRTSPQSKLTSTAVHYKNAEGKLRRGTINPDAVIFFRSWEGETLKPHFFYLEYESGTKDGFEYRADKLTPYYLYVRQARRPERRNSKTRYFDDIGRDIITGYGLNYPENTTPTFQVLTVSRDADDVRKMFTTSTALGSKELFLFTSLEEFIDNPFANIWHRKREFEELGYLEEYQRLDELLSAKTMQYSVFLKWCRETLNDERLKVTLG